MSNSQNPTDMARPEEPTNQLQEPTPAATNPTTPAIATAKDDAVDPICAPEAQNKPPVSPTTPRQEGIRSTTPELTPASRERLAAFLGKLFGDDQGTGDPDDNSSALIDLVKRESEVRARRHQVWVEEVEDEAFRAGHGHSM